MANEIIFTKEGGNYYRARLFFYLSILLLSIPVVLSVIIALLNPFWFRDRVFVFVEVAVERIVHWRNYQQYKIYLGMDPKVWHTLKD